MFFSKKRNMLFSTAITVVFTWFFTGNMGVYLSGLSPYFSFAGLLEESYFSQADHDWQTIEKKYQREVKAKISGVISNYQTGLGVKDREMIPHWIVEQSRKYGYDPLFLTALIVTESSFYNWANSNRGALGLMQIRLGTGLALATETRIQWEGRPTLFDPGTNIALGAYYLSKLILRYGDLGLALEAYNHGPTKMDEYLKKGYRPGQYSNRVFRLYGDLRSESI